jgi:hypothetical protein
MRRPGLACALALIAPAAYAQRMDARFSPDGTGSTARDSAAAQAVRAALERPRRLPVWSAPIASAIVPGTGQAILGQQRVVAYLAVEGFVWLEYFKDRNDEASQRTGYRNLAAAVARSAFSSNPPIGTWPYYELMRHYRDSGVYSLSGSLTDVQPETDESTYNGAQWLLARTTYWASATPPPTTSAAYQTALAFYEARAIRPEFRWSWSNAQLEQDLYSGMIDRANSANRRETSALGIIVANHLLSSVDAFAIVRLRMSLTSTGAYKVSCSVPLP